MVRPAAEAGGEDAAEGGRLGGRAGLPVGRQRPGGDVDGVDDVRRDGEGDVSKDRGWGAEDDGSREAPRVRISFDRGEKQGWDWLDQTAVKTVRAPDRTARSELL